MTDDDVIERAAEVIRDSFWWMAGGEGQRPTSVEVTSGELQIAYDLNRAGLLRSPRTEAEEAERGVLVASQAWRQTKYAMHGNTAEASRRHAESVRGVERHLRQKVETWLAALDASEGQP